MKIYLDNEIEEYRKKVFLVSSYNKDIYDDINSIIDALKAYGYTEDSIKEAFIDKCLSWKLIDINPDFSGETD